MDRAVQREFIAAGMDTEFQIAREIVNTRGMREHRQISGKFTRKRLDVSAIVHAFIEPSAELWRDGLDRYLLIGDRRKNNQQLYWRLRRICLFSKA